MTRPKSIVNFERLYLGSWLLSLVSTAINWNQTKELMAVNPGAKQLGMDFMMNMLIGGLVFAAIITLVLWYFTARQHSVVAKWFVVVFFVLGLFGIPGIIAAFAQGEALVGGFALVVLLLSAGSVVMLFQRDARVWFGEIKGPPGDVQLTDTFQ